MRRALAAVRALLLVVPALLVAGAVQMVAPPAPAGAATPCYFANVNTVPSCQLQVGENGNLQNSQTSNLASTLQGQAGQAVSLGAEWVDSANFGAPPTCTDASINLNLRESGILTIISGLGAIIVCGYWIMQQSGVPASSGPQFYGVLAVADWVNAYDNPTYQAWGQPVSQPSSPLGATATWACISGAATCPYAALRAEKTNGEVQLCEQASIGGVEQTTWCSANGTTMADGQVLPNSDFGSDEAFQNPQWQEPYVNQPVSPTPTSLVLQTDGNLVLYTPSGQAVWSTGGGMAATCPSGGLFCIPVNNGENSAYPPSPPPCSAGSGQAVVQNPGSCQNIVWFWQSGSGAQQCDNSAQAYFSTSSPSSPVYSPPSGCNVQSGVVSNAAGQPQVVTTNVTLPSNGQQFFAAAVVYAWSAAGAYAGTGAGYQFPLEFWSSGLITMGQPTSAPPPSSGPPPLNSGQADFYCTTPDNPVQASSCTEVIDVPVNKAGQVVGAPHVDPNTVVTVAGTGSFPSQSQLIEGGASYGTPVDLTADGVAPGCSFFGVDCAANIGVSPAYEPPGQPVTWSVTVYAGEALSVGVVVSGPPGCAAQGDTGWGGLLGDGYGATASGTFYPSCGQPSQYTAQLIVYGTPVASASTVASNADYVLVEQEGTAINILGNSAGFPPNGLSPSAGPGAGPYSQVESGTYPTVCADYQGQGCQVQVVWPSYQIPPPPSYLPGSEMLGSLSLEGFPVAVNLNNQARDYFIAGSPASTSYSTPDGVYSVSASPVTVNFEWQPQVQVTPSQPTYVATTTTVSLNPSAELAGSPSVAQSTPITVDAPVAGSTAPAGGTVQFVGPTGQVLPGCGAQPLLLDVAQCDITLADIDPSGGPGDFQVTASYSGYTQGIVIWQPSSGTSIEQVVAPQHPTSTSVQLSPNPSWPGQTDTLSAQVSSGGTGVPAGSGQVVFTWGAGQDCVAGQVGTGGTATCQAALISNAASSGSFPPLTVTAQFVPNPGSQYGPSSGSATETFQSPTLSLSAVPSSTYFGDAVQLEATSSDPYASSCSVALQATPQSAADAANSTWGSGGTYTIPSPNTGGIWSTSYTLSKAQPGEQQDVVQFSGQLVCPGLGTVAQSQTSATWVVPPPQPGVPT